MNEPLPKFIDSCPSDYRYSPEVFRVEPSLPAETVYVVGGLYGNLEALQAILEMKRREERNGTRVVLVFNGDFNWFNIDAAGFREINETVLQHTALQGNVEAELSHPSEGAGCGCNYPDYVDRGVVERSNRIMAHLQQRAAEFPDLIERLGRLPMTLTANVGGERIGILHGDPESLAGWAFAVEHMTPAEGRSNAKTGFRPVTPMERIRHYFRAANVRVFTCTHTCLPFAQDFTVDGQPCLVINNGSAGMPNFLHTAYGLITRVSANPEPHPGSLYGINLGPVRCDALVVPFDRSAWLRRFERNWPPGSAAHVSYFKRIVEGPAFHVSEAIRGRV